MLFSVDAFMNKTLFVARLPSNNPNKLCYLWYVIVFSFQIQSILPRNSNYTVLQLFNVVWQSASVQAAAQITCESIISSSFY